MEENERVPHARQRCEVLQILHLTGQGHRETRAGGSIPEGIAFGLCGAGKQSMVQLHRRPGQSSHIATLSPFRIIIAVSRGGGGAHRDQRFDALHLEAFARRGGDGTFEVRLGGVDERRAERPCRQMRIVP